jgi:hypothetical protein
VSTLELELYSESEKREERRRTAFEYITALVIPSLALIASAAAVNSHPRITITLVVLACASFVAGLFPPVYASARRWRARRAAEAVAETAFPEIKKFVRRFEDFIDGRQNNTLHAIVQSDLCEGAPFTTLSTFPIWESGQDSGVSSPNASTRRNPLFSQSAATFSNSTTSSARITICASPRFLSACLSSLRQG